MITVGLIKELFYISVFFQNTIETSIKMADGYSPVNVVVTPIGKLTVFYKDQKIWSETISGETNMFGVESCDSIARIIVCIDNNTDWSQYKWQESLDK